MPISNPTFKSAPSSTTVNPGSYFAGIAKVMKSTLSQITDSFKSDSKPVAGGDIRELDEKLLNDIGLTSADRNSAMSSSDLAHHQHQRMYWY